MEPLTDKLTPEQRDWIHKRTKKIVGSWLDNNWITNRILTEIYAFLNANTTEDEPVIKEACKDHWHKEKNMWAYVECDCEHCKEARNQIALRKIEEWLSCSTAEFIKGGWEDKVQSFIIWLQQEDNE